MFSKHQWTWRSKQLFKTLFFKLLYCLFIFIFSIPSIFYAVYNDFHSFAPLKYESLTGWTEYEEKNLEDVLTSQYCSEDDCQIFVLSWADVWKFFKPQMRGWRMLDYLFMWKLLFAINMYLWHNSSVTLLSFCKWFH